MGYEWGMLPLPSVTFYFIPITFIKNNHEHALS